MDADEQLGAFGELGAVATAVAMIVILVAANTCDGVYAAVMKMSEGGFFSVVSLSLSSLPSMWLYTELQAVEATAAASVLMV